MEVTYPVLYVQTFMTVFDQFTRSDDSFVLILYSACLYISCMILVSVVHYLSFHFLYDPCQCCPSCFLSFLLTTRLNLLILQTKSSCVFPQVRRIFSEKQYTVMWQVLWSSPSPEQARPYVQASERKLRDVGFLELVPSQGRKSKNSNVNNFLSSCFKF